MFEIKHEDFDVVEEPASMLFFFWDKYRTQQASNIKYFENIKFNWYIIGGLVTYAFSSPSAKEQFVYNKKAIRARINHIDKSTRMIIAESFRIKECSEIYNKHVMSLMDQIKTSGN